MCFYFSLFCKEVRGHSSKGSTVMLFCKNYLLGNGSQTKNVASFDMLRYMLFKACTAQNKRNHSTIVNRCSGVDEDTVLCRKLIEFLSQSTAQMRSTDVAAQHFSGAEDTVQWHKLTRLLRGVAQDGREIIVFLEYRGRTWVSFSRSYRHLTTPHNSTVGRESRFVFSKLFARGWTPLEGEVSDSVFIENLRVQRPVGLVIYVTGDNEAGWQRRSNLEFICRFQAPVVVVKPQNFEPFYPGYENQAYLMLNVGGASSPFLADIAHYLRSLAMFYCSELSAGSFVSKRFRNEAAFYGIQNRWVSLIRGLMGVRRASFRRVRYAGRKVLQRR